MFGQLQIFQLTGLFFSSKINFESSDWPDPIWEFAFNGKRREECRVARDLRIKGMQKTHEMYQSRHWQLDDGRRTRTSFKGRPELTLKDRPFIPAGAPQKIWLQTLEEADYDFREIRFVIIFSFILD